jgi:hypothetical protein
MNNKLGIVPEIKITMDTYAIAYSSEGVAGLDLTSNLAELLTLVVYHDKHSDSYDVYKLKPEVNK